MPKKKDGKGMPKKIKEPENPNTLVLLETHAANKLHSAHKVTGKEFDGLAIQQMVG